MTKGLPIRSGQFIYIAAVEDIVLFKHCVDPLARQIERFFFNEIILSKRQLPEGALRKTK